MTISQLIGFSTDSSILHEMKNGEYPKNLEFSPFFSVPDVIRTRGLPLRRRTLYPAELQKRIKNRSFLPELNLCYSFVIFTWSMFEHSLRRQSLYPTELQELIYIITVLCNRYNQIIQFWNSQLVYYIFTEFASIVSAPDARRRFPGLPCPCNFHR